MTGTNEPIELAAMSRHELVKLIRKQEQQVNTLAGEQEYAKRQAIFWNDKAVALKQQVNTLTEALEFIKMLGLSEASGIAHRALQSIKDTPREEQGK